MRIIWFAMVITLAIYGAILMTLNRTWEGVQRSPAEILHAPLVLPLAGAAIGTLVLAFVFPPVMRRRGIPVRSSMIMQWTLIEAVAIYGLIASFLVQDLRPYYAGGAVALAAFLATFPTEDRMTTV